MLIIHIRKSMEIEHQVVEEDLVLRETIGRVAAGAIAEKWLKRVHAELKLFHG